jgi:transcription antitermination factor NusG
MARLWFTLHSHPNKEDLLWQQALSHGFEIFYPRIRVYPVNPRARKIRPYFPGYLFIRVNLEEVGLSVLQWMPYSTGLVSFGGEPAVVPENLIVTLKQRITEISESGGELFDSLKPGDPVMIASGPFAGYEAIFNVRLDGNERVRILLKMLNKQQVPVELNVAFIQKKKNPLKP